MHEFYLVSQMQQGSGWKMQILYPTCIWHPFFRWLCRLGGN